MSAAPAYHPEMAAGRWYAFNLDEQLGNIGSEVSRALSWREKNNEDLAWTAFAKSLELLNLTIDAPALNVGRRWEIGRVKEAFSDYFAGDNQYHSTAQDWRNYFDYFALRARATV